jgi:hypothetical protein
MAEVNGKLADVIDSRQLAFNVGSSQGIKVGVTARMYREIQISDPETHEMLGGVRVPKLSLRVNFVDDKFCIAEVTDVANDDGNPVLSNVFATRKKVTTSRSLTRSDTVYVKIGEEATFYIPETRSPEEN